MDLINFCSIEYLKEMVYKNIPCVESETFLFREPEKLNDPSFDEVIYSTDRDLISATKFVFTLDMNNNKDPTDTITYYLFHGGIAWWKDSISFGQVSVNEHVEDFRLIKEMTAYDTNNNSTSFEILCE